MRTDKTIVIRILGLALLFAFVADSAVAAEYQLSLGEGHGEPGQVASAPVFLSCGTDVAAIEFQINYEASLLSIVGVTNPVGSLGAEFSIDYEIDGGRLIVRLFRNEGLVSGTGLLCQVLYQVNSGAEPTMWSDLILADIGLATQYGADLTWKNILSQQNSKFWVTFSATHDSDLDGLSDYAEQMLNGSADYLPNSQDSNINNPDTDGDGLPDGWEANHSLNALVNDATDDLDGDGLNNAQEFACGTYPGIADTDGDGMSDRNEFIAGTSGTNPSEFLWIEPEVENSFLLNWQTQSGRMYSIFSTTNLAVPWPVVPDSQISGDGTRKTYTNGNPSEGFRYFRIGVELE